MRTRYPLTFPPSLEQARPCSTWSHSISGILWGDPFELKRPYVKTPYHTDQGRIFCIKKRRFISRLFLPCLLRRGVFCTKDEGGTLLSWGMFLQVGSFGKLSGSSLLLGQKKRRGTFPTHSSWGSIFSSVACEQYQVNFNGSILIPVLVTHYFLCLFLLKRKCDFFSSFPGSKMKLSARIRRETARVINAENYCR